MPLPENGVVGIIGNDSARYSAFWACADKLILPKGWRKEYVIGGDWCGARNSLCQHVLDSGADWLWFMDDDHTFAPEILLKLVRWEKELVVPVCLMRTQPFLPVTFSERLEDDSNGNARYLPVYYPEHDDSGLIMLEAGGCAGMLIHRNVIEAIEPPWFEYGFASEDLIFCQKAQDAGFPLYCDLSARVGHITTAEIWPAVDADGEWCVGITVGGGASLIIPWAEQVREEVPA